MLKMIYAAAGGSDALRRTMMGEGNDPIFAKVNEFHGKEIIPLLKMLKHPEG